ncbi:hypothetical protein O0L34_g10032 [Tuta absoluta]|nr:hypothetical protein O0L34_g10032 [Tuta absoluta]
MTPEQKLAWLCQECFSKLPKWVNSETPASPAHRAATGNEPSPKLSKNIHIKESDRKNVTTRKPATPSSSTSPLLKDTSNDGDNKDVIAAISDRVLAAVRKELPSMFEKILNTELAQLKDEFQVIRTLVKSQKSQLAKHDEELKRLREFSDFIGKAHDDMKSSTESLTEENGKLLAQISELNHEVHYLSDRLNNLDQYLRESNIEIHGVPEFRTEKLSNLINQCATVVGCPLNDDDIVNCTRVAKQDVNSKFPRIIVVKFKSVKCRDEFYSAVHRYNKSKPVPSEKLNTALLGIAGDKKPVYIAEHLSPANKSLHAAARKKAKEFGYRFTWVRNGRIYVRKSPESTYILIKNKDSLGLIC